MRRLSAKPMKAELTLKSLPAANDTGAGAKMKPLALDLCCGLGGWTSALLAEGWDVIGYDIERHDYGNGAYPGELVLQDIRTLDGRQFRGKVSLIVCGPPCTEYSYMAMPWSRAKQIRAALLGKGAFPKGYKGSRTIEQLNELFNACIRISQEAGCPIIIENVRGAQEWVGRARWNFGSFYLWGDVPALMPIPSKARKNYNADPKCKAELGVKAGNRNTAAATGGHKWSNSFADTLKGEGNKTAGMNWSDPASRGKPAVPIPGRKKGISFTDAAGFAAMEGREGIPHRTNGHWTNPAEHEGVKGFTPSGGPLGKNVLGRKHGSKSKLRKRASAEIAKIPPTLARGLPESSNLTMKITQSRDRAENYRAANREKIKARLRAYRAANREKIKAALRDWQAANPESRPRRKI